ncbi:MAG TPA: GAF domain-containing protein, partial [Actinomycetota bacterium]|nr:GAF domain-containing protein [Actinomycetota bacterium]
MGEDVLLLAIVAGSVVLGLGATAGFVAGGRRAERALGETLHEASSIVSSAFTSGDSYRALDEMARRLAELLDADVCVVALPTGDGRLFCGPTFGFDEPEGLFIREEEGVCGAVYSSGEPLVVPDVSKEPRFISRIEGIRSTVAVPLRHEESVLGSVAFESRTRVYRERDLSVLVPLADQIAAVLENLRLRLSAEERAAEENRIRKETQAISSVVMAGVSTTSDLDAALHSMIREISAQMGWESLAVVLYDDDGLLHTRAYYGYPLHAASVSFRPGEGVIGGVAKGGVGRLIKDVSTEPDFLDLVQDTRSEMCVPLQIGTKTLGVLNAESPRAGAFTEED